MFLGGEGGSVKIEEASHMRVRGELWLDSTAAQEIEGELAPGEDFVQEVEGKLVVGGAKAGDDVIFGGVDATFN